MLYRVKGREGLSEGNFCFCILSMNIFTSVVMASLMEKKTFFKLYPLTPAEHGGEPGNAGAAEPGTVSQRTAL